MVANGAIVSERVLSVRKYENAKRKEDCLK